MITQAFRVSALLLLLSCASPDVGDDSSVIEVFSWWTAPGEVEALDALLTVHRDREPHVTIVNAAASNLETARSRLTQRLAQGEPPSTFQANAGSDLIQFVLFSGDDPTSSVLSPLNGLFDDEGWTDVFPTVVLDACSYEDQLYAVPLNVHRVNSLFANLQVLSDHDLEVPTTLDELYATCEQLETQSIPCLAMGTGPGQGWTIRQALFDSVLVSIAGVDFYTELLSGNGDPNSPLLEEAANATIRLASYANENASSLRWDEATSLVASGDAAFVIMGDWAKGLLTAEGLEPDVDFTQVAFPGSGGVFVFSSDAFTLPVRVENFDRAADFLRTIASVEGQVAFNRLKGSIPVRTDVSMVGFDSLSQRQMTDFRSAELVLSASNSPSIGEAVDEALIEMLEREEAEVFLNVFRNRYGAVGNL